MARVGKKFDTAQAKIDPNAKYSLEESLDLAKEVAFANFDESVDISVKLGVNPKYADQMVRGSCVLPHGTGKEVKVLVFCKGEKVMEAKEAGADFVGLEEFAEKIQKEGWFEFDKAIATPDVMAVVGRLGRLLGPRGLMPNPKVGTVTFDVAQAVQDAKAGKIEFRVEKAGIIHSTIGRRSFESTKLIDNAMMLIETLMKLKPSSAKGAYVKGIALSTTMGPGVKVDVNQVLASLQK